MDSCSRTRIFVHLCCLISFLIMCAFGICIVTASAGSSSEIHCIPREREALLRFKHRLQDPSNRLSSWDNASNPNCCLWPGVLCSNLTSHVLQLHLNTPEPNEDYDILAEYEAANEAYLKSRFGGEVDDSLVELKHLNHLDLSGNYFGGMQIPSFLSQITSLTYLNLSDAGFYGEIPHHIGNLSNLLYLDLSFAAIGSIPYQIGNLTKLLHLDLQSFYALYDFPVMVAENLHWLSGLSCLQYLDLSGADLSKSSDWLQSLQALPALEELHLQGCALRNYKQPESTLNFSSLHSLSISIAPKWIFRLTRLVSLQFGSNYYFTFPPLNGPIPDGIQNLTMLESLDLSGNSFSSSIPEWLYGLHHLKSLRLNQNSLHGAIPEVVGNLTSLISLDLSNNQLVEAIPTSLGRLISLVSLDLSNNQLKGVIPFSLGSLNSLVRLDLSNNQLEGVIPNSFSNLCNLKEISFSSLKSNQKIYDVFEIFTPCISAGLKSLKASSAQISGNLTDQFEMFKNLVSLDFSSNSIFGTLPPSLGKVLTLKELYLSDNKLNGNPFKILGSIPKLTTLYIDDNLFQGVVKEYDLANFTNLKGLEASSNNFTFEVNPNWQPKFQLSSLGMASCQLGSSFPSWIKSQRNLGYLDMSNVGISNSIPTWFWKNFPRAYYLNLSHNHINGELPNTLQNMESMQLIDLSSNRLHGQLPYFPGHLEWLDLSHNSFSGSVTNLLCRKGDEETKLLQFLNLASNKLSGEIPDCWEMWPYLVDVNLQSNYFIRNLPSSMGSLTELQSLHCGSNKLSGEFPLILKNTTELVLLDLGGNNLTGAIPPWVGERLLNLKILQLRSNQFSSNLPNEMCDMKLLQDLDLAQNSLSGNIPKCFNHLSAMVLNKSNANSFIHVKNTLLGRSIVSVVVWVKGKGVEYKNILGLVKSIDLSDNKLSGEIPEEITDLSGLIYLNLSNNQLTGHIPQSIGNMRSLESMYLSSNQLSGEIPPTITSLSFLNKLNLSNNHLKGKIPTGTQLQSFEASSFVGNDLCGPPLLVNCSLNGEVHNGDHNDRKHKKHGVNWFFVSMAFGFIVGFWGVVLPLFTCRSWRYAYFRFLDNMWYKLQSFW